MFVYLWIIPRLLRKNLLDPWPDAAQEIVACFLQDFFLIQQKKCPGDTFVHSVCRLKLGI